MNAIATASGLEVRAEAWTALACNQTLAGEVDRFMHAVKERFGAAGLREFTRTGVFDGANVDPSERTTLGEIGRHVQAASQGHRAAETSAQKLTKAVKSSLGARLSS